MTGFKSFEAAEATLSGIELHHMLKKNQLDSDENQPVLSQKILCAVKVQAF